MILDTIIYIFQTCDSYTKIPFSLTSREIYEHTRLHIQPIKQAISNADVFSIINTPGWYETIHSRQLGYVAHVPKAG